MGRIGYNRIAGLHLGRYVVEVHLADAVGGVAAQLFPTCTP
jgi:hypothetical protein